MKKIFSLLLISVLILAFETSVYATEVSNPDNEKTYEDGYREGLNEGYDEGYSDGIEAGKEKMPLITVIEEESIVKANAGETLELKVVFKNDSEHTAKDLTVVPVLEDTPLVYERPMKYEYDKSLKSANKCTATFSIDVAENAQIGTYPLKLKLSYKNTRDEVFEKEETVYFKIVEEKLKPILTISNINNSSEKIKAGDTFELSFDINNIGGIDAKDVEILLEGFSKDSIMPIDSKDYKYVGNIFANEKSTVRFNLLASSEIDSKNNVITANISYKDASNEVKEISKEIYILDVGVSGDNIDGKTAKPKMIISSYNLNPKDVVAGDVFNLKFTFKNTSKEKKIRNIKITVSSDEGAFIITKGSNTFYVEEMDKQAVITKQIELKAKQDLTSNSYKVLIDFDYEDYDGEQYNATESLNIPVVEYSKLIINSVYAGEGYINSPTSLSFDYVNMGRATVSNLTASVEGDYEAVQSINYIGNLNTGTSDYYDIEVKPTKEGKNYGVLILSFEDSSGGIVEVKKEFEGNAFAENFFEPVPDVIPDYIDTQMDETEEFSVLEIVLYGIGAFVIAFVITKIITTKIIRKKLEEEL